MPKTIKKFKLHTEEDWEEDFDRKQRGRDRAHKHRMRNLERRQLEWSWASNQD